MKPIIRKETISMIVDPSTINGYVLVKNFLDNELLRNVKIWGVQTYYIDIFKSSLDFPDTEYPALPTKGQFRRLFLNLYDTKDDNFCHIAPFPIFQSIENGTLRTNKYGDSFTIQEKDFKYFCGQTLNLQKSGILFVGTNQDKPFTIVLDIYYSRIDLDKI